jgi:hypothetical protein
VLIDEEERVFDKDYKGMDDWEYDEDKDDDMHDHKGGGEGVLVTVLVLLMVSAAGFGGGYYYYKNYYFQGAYSLLGTYVTASWAHTMGGSIPSFVKTCPRGHHSTILPLSILPFKHVLRATSVLRPKCSCISNIMYILIFS